MKLAANLSMMYTEWDLFERFDQAALDGFTGVEIQFPYSWDAARLGRCLRDAGLQQALINAPSGDPARNERGLAVLPGRSADFRAGFMRALHYADAMACPRIHVMAGVMDDATPLASVRDGYMENLAWAAAEARKAHVDVLIEPINRRDIPGYMLNRQQDAHDIVALVGADNIFVQMDLYHCQIVEGDVAKKLEKYLPTGRVAYLQIAGVPDRHEPDHGELNYGYLFECLARLRYDGWIGCEYRPAADTRRGLAWIAALAPQISMPAVKSAAR